MYLSADDFEADALRQGDVIKGVQILGALNLRSVQVIKDHSEKDYGWMVPNAPVYQDAMVLPILAKLILPTELN